MTPEAEKAAAPVEYDNKGAVALRPPSCRCGSGKQRSSSTASTGEAGLHKQNLQPLGDTPINLLLTPNSSIEHQFGRKQNLPQPVGCNIHPWMKGFDSAPRLCTRPSKRHVTCKFERSSSLPVVEIELQVWHEKSDWPPSRNGKRPLHHDAERRRNDSGELKVDPGLFNK